MIWEWLFWIPALQRNSRKNSMFSEEVNSGVITRYICLKVFLVIATFAKQVNQDESTWKTPITSIRSIYLPPYFHTKLITSYPHYLTKSFDTRGVNRANTCDKFSLRNKYDFWLSFSFPTSQVSFLKFTKECIVPPSIYQPHKIQKVNHYYFVLDHKMHPWSLFRNQEWVGGLLNNVWVICHPQ